MGASKKTMGESKLPTNSARMSTPPPPSDRGRLDSKPNAESSGNTMRQLRSRTRASDVAHPAAFDVDAVDSLLLRELQHPHRESTPGASPHRKRQRINGDRLVNPPPGCSTCF